MATATAYSSAASRSLGEAPSQEPELHKLSVCLSSLYDQAANIESCLRQTADRVFGSLPEVGQNDKTAPMPPGDLALCFSGTEALRRQLNNIHEAMLRLQRL